MKTLSSLLHGMLDDGKLQMLTTVISGISCNTQHLHRGDVFLALPGSHTHGMRFATQAVELGAAAILYEPTRDISTADFPTTVPCLAVPHLSQHIQLLADRFYGDLFSALQLIVVTGTDGKTSTTQLIAQALQFLGEEVAVLGGLGYGRLQALKPTHNTTPDFFSLRKILAELIQDGIHYVVMEVSSHALSQERVAGLTFQQAIFTNLTRDHLDYHKTAQEYRDAKRRLFQDYAIQHAILNADDKESPHLAAILKKRDIPVSQFSLTCTQDCFVTEICYQPHGIHFMLNTPSFCLPAHIALLGRFNISNAMAVFLALKHIGFGVNQIIQAISALYTVNGRMQRFVGTNSPIAVVDYAHTPAALAQVLQTLRDHCNGGLLWVIFGCGGDRDRGKRPLMAQAAIKWADRVVVTNDNPRSEDPAAIAEEILQGVSQTHRKTITICLDREQAIQNTLRQASSNDMVLIAGKGHEDYQIIGDRALFFLDASVVCDELRIS